MIILVIMVCYIDMRQLPRHDKGIRLILSYLFLPAVLCEIQRLITKKPLLAVFFPALPYSVIYDYNHAITYDIAYMKR